MSSFSQRYGYVEEPSIQFECMSDSLRNRLWNKVYSVEFDADPFSKHNNDLTNIEKLMDSFGLTFVIPRTERERFLNAKKLKEFLFDETKWFLMYDFIEKYIALFHKTYHKELSNEFNEILENECAGYRVVKSLVVPITNEAEIKAIEKASNTKFTSVNTHIEKGLALFSNRKNHDYENTIKEAISAVEAMCCIITGMSGAQATLGTALKKLEDSGIHIHGAMKNAFSSLYGYASDENGIRHGGIDFTNAPVEDAKYMLVSCSAFVNYLIEKWGKITENTEV